METREVSNIGTSVSGHGQILWIAVSFNGPAMIIVESAKLVIKVFSHCLDPTPSTSSWLLKSRMSLESDN